MLSSLFLFVPRRDGDELKKSFSELADNKTENANTKSISSGSNPFLSISHDPNAAVYKTGFLGRKIHADMDGKKSESPSLPPISSKLVLLLNRKTIQCLRITQCLMARIHSTSGPVEHIAVGLSIWLMFVFAIVRKLDSNAHLLKTASVILCSWVMDDVTDIKYHILLLI